MLVSELTQPPEAALIENLRTALRPKLSVRRAAGEAGISDSRWRQIINGFKYETGGVRVPARAPDDTLVRMALVVGASPDQLRDSGRTDAADELQTQLTQIAQQANTPGAMSSTIGGVRADLEGTVSPTDEPTTQELFKAEEERLSKRWQEVRDLASELSGLADAPESLRDVARRIIFTRSADLIIRILSGPHAPQFEGWLNRIYVEREQLFRAVTIGEPAFPWYGPNPPEAVRYDPQHGHFVVVSGAQSSHNSEAAARADAAIAATLTPKLKADGADD